MSEKKKLLRPFDYFVLVVALGILAFIVLQNNGIHIVERTESVEMYRPGERRGSATDRVVQQDRDRDRQLEQALQQLAARISDEEITAAPQERDIPVDGLSRDERDYLGAVEKRYAASEKLQDARDWLTVLRGSYRTYSQVRSIFGELSGQTEEAMEQQGQVNQWMAEPQARERTLERLKDSFDIPKEDLDAFARLGKNKLSEWAEFLDQYAAE
ncbi:MAG: hypothetical protein AAFV95_22650 [Bacteroidota bacterium]